MSSNRKISIQPFFKVDKKEWDEFLKTSSESTFFCTSHWWSMFEEARIIQVRSGENKLEAGLPFRIISVLPIVGRFFKYLWLDSSVLIDERFDNVKQYEIKRCVFDHLLKYVRKTNVVVMFVSTKSRSLDGILFRELFNVQEKCATYMLNIAKDENEIFSSFARRRRRSIRKAYDLNLKIDIQQGMYGLQLVSDFCQLQKSLFKNKNDSYPSIYYKSEEHINSLLMSNESVIIAIAYFNGKPVAGRICVGHKKTLFDYIAASDLILNRLTNASSLLQYEIFKAAKKMGYALFDFGGIPSVEPSKADDLFGVYMFKKEFGGIKKEFDCTTYAIKRSRYRFVWRLRKLERQPFAVAVYNFAKKLNRQTSRAYGCDV